MNIITICLLVTEEHHNFIWTSQCVPQLMYRLWTMNIRVFPTFKSFMNKNVNYLGILCISDEISNRFQRLLFRALTLFSYKL